MAGKTLFPLLGNLGGINAGSPFLVDHATFVQSVVPPLINTQRLARINDVSQSLIAPGVNAGAHSLVMGESVIDSIRGDRAIMYGYNLQQNSPAVAGAAADQVIVGNGILVPLTSTDAVGLVAIGAAMTFTGFPGVANTFGNSVIIGRQAKLICVNLALGDASNNVVIGANAQAVSGGGVALGSSAQTSDSEAAALGQLSTAAVQCVAVGSRSSASDHSVAVGRGAQAGALGVAIGQGASALGGTNTMAFGALATVQAGVTGSMAFGVNALIVAGLNNLALFGSTTVPINEMRFGNGHNLNTAGRTYTFTTTDRDTTNNATGNTLLVRAGLGTGNWANAENLGLGLQVGLAVGAGNAQQTATTVMAIRHADTNVALWGGFGAAFGGGVRALYLSNATANPAGAIAGGGLFYVTGGKVHWLSSAGVDTDLTAGGGGGTITGGGTIGNVAVFTGATAVGNIAAGVDILMAVDAGKSFTVTVGADNPFEIQAGPTKQNIQVFSDVNPLNMAGGDGVLYIEQATTPPDQTMAGFGFGTLLWTDGGDSSWHWMLNDTTEWYTTPLEMKWNYEGNGDITLFSMNPDVGNVYILWGEPTMVAQLFPIVLGQLLWGESASIPGQPSLSIDAGFSPIPDLGFPALGGFGGEWKDLYLVGAVKQRGTNYANPAHAGTLTNAPHAGDPDAYIEIWLDSGAGLVKYAVPGWIP